MNRVQYFVSNCNMSICKVSNCIVFIWMPLSPRCTISHFPARRWPSPPLPQRALSRRTFFFGASPAVHFPFPASLPLSSVGVFTGVWAGGAAAVPFAHYASLDGEGEEASTAWSITQPLSWRFRRHRRTKPRLRPTATTCPRPPVATAGSKNSQRNSARRSSISAPSFCSRVCSVICSSWGHSMSSPCSSGR